jgi:hypothetical protein
MSERLTTEALERVRRYCGDGIVEIVVGFESDLADAQREIERLREALIEIHDFHCGCDTPGRLDRCVAPPALSFTVLNRTKPEKSPAE